MAIEMRADDMMPWGKHVGETLREIYEDDYEYFEYLKSRSWEYKISKKTLDILAENEDIEDKSTPTFSKGGCLGRTELFADTIVPSHDYVDMTLEDIFFINESLFRAYVSGKKYFVSNKTYEKLMIKKYGPDSVVKRTRKDFDKLITGTINGFTFSEDEGYTEEDLKPYLGEKVETVFSDATQNIIANDIKNDRFGLEMAIKEVFGPKAKYREGQKEAVLSVLNGKRTLVVQHTGWGKSLVYFMAIKKLREMGRGFAVIISPLLALMHNQVESTDKYGLNVRAIASDNKKEWAEIYDDLENDELDALVVSPERLADDSFFFLMDEHINDISVFVVDEAHCISDWGHDFRPDFRRIVRIIRKLPETTPVLATTATANDRVVRDIKKQLGKDLEVTRGSMERTSIAISVEELGTDDEKQRWLKYNIPKFSGVGIVYCLTIRACEEVVVYLRTNGINAEIYHSELDPKDKMDIEQEFQRNEIKVLVATVAFGMGIDKPDIQFVIHYHQPASAIAYYQQIGRAGRSIDKAYAILLAGDDDNEINSYFIKNAFPTENEMNSVIDLLRLNPGLGRNEIMDKLNVGQKWTDKVLKYLLVNGDITKKKSKYYKSERVWKCDMKRARIVSWYRWQELRRFNQYIYTDECYMSFIRGELNDENVEPCGRCSNCLGQSII